MYDTDEAAQIAQDERLDSFVGKEVHVTTNSGVTSKITFTATFDGILVDNSSDFSGYYSVQVGDESLEGLGLAEVRFSKSSVKDAWVAASGNIIRLHS